MENNINRKITQEQKNKLLALSPIEIIDKYYEGMLKSLEDEYTKAPINIDVHRETVTKENQDFRTSFYMSSVIAKLKVVGTFYSKIDNNQHINAFDYGLKLFLQNLTQSYKEEYFSREQYENTRKLVNEYILDEALEDIKKYFFLGYKNIPQYDMIFLLYEFSYRSPIHQIGYNFEGKDIRRTTFGRIEITALNKYQDYKLNINNIEDQLLDGISDFAYNIQELVDIVFIQKEVQYRVALLNEIYFNFEHFLSVIITNFRMADTSLGKKRVTKKQEYLARVFNELKINHHIDYAVISKEIQDRCIESSPKYLNILEQTDKQTISLIDMFIKIIDMRNSLHSNGFSNKDSEAFNIAKMTFNEVKKDQQFSSMAMHQVIALFIITSYSMELIIKKLSTIKEVNGVEVPTILIDDYVESISRIKANI